MDKNRIIHTAYDGGQLGSQWADLHGEISSNRPEPVPWKRPIVLFMISSEHTVEAVCNNKGEKKSASDNNIQKKKKEI